VTQESLGFSDSCTDYEFLDFTEEQKITFARNSEKHNVPRPLFDDLSCLRGRFLLWNRANWK
jgi:hypothetical protein